MPTVVQTAYGTRIRFGRAGMMADMTDSQISTWLVETAAGIPCGRAVSKGTGDRGIVIGGGAGFVGVTIEDITLNTVPLSPLFPDGGTYPPVDVYPQYFNAGVCSRGRAWVNAGSTVAAGAGVFADANGAFTGNASGAAASGKVAFVTNPVVGNTITIAGSAVSFVASGATGLQVNIQGTLHDTLDALVTMLNASADINLVKFTYLDYPLGGANELHFAAATVGTAGNGLAVTTNIGSATVTAPSGGSAAATAVTGAFWVTSATGGEPAVISLALQR